MRMKGNIHKKINIVMLIVGILAVTLFIKGAADGAAPGSDQDPIVTQSYVEQKSDQLKYYIDTLIAKANDSLGAQTTDISNLKAALEQKNQEIAKLKDDVAKLQQGGGAGAKFEVVQLAAGKTMLTGEGTELIARSGKSTAIFGANGGLTDVSAAKDLKAGDAVLANHMLISSRDDGRGVKAVQDSFYIVKGSYTIK